MENKRSIALFLVVLVTIIETTTGASPPPPSTNFACITQLFVCRSNNASTPCCDALKTAYNNQTDCLCTVINSQNAVDSLGLNGTQVSNLVVECKIATNTTDMCGSAPLPFPPGLLTPPGSALHAPPPPDSNDASVPYNAMWISLSGLASALFMYYGY